MTSYYAPAVNLAETVTPPPPPLAQLLKVMHLWNLEDGI